VPCAGRSPVVGLIFLAVLVPFAGLVPQARGDALADAEAAMRRAQIAMDHRDFAAAITHYEVARALEPDSTGPYLGLGLAYAAQGRCAEAVPLVTEYLRRKTVSPHPSAQATLIACGQTPSSPRPAPSRAGRVLVLSEPAGADVRVDDDDGRAPGRTPIELSLAPGRHDLRLTLPGYRAERAEVTAVAGTSATVHATFQPSLPAWVEPPPAHLSLRIGDAAGEVTLNGRRLPGEHRQLEVDLVGGEYQLTVERRGFERETRALFLRIGETAREEVTLVPAGRRALGRKVGLGFGLALGLSALAAAIALGIVYGTPPPPSQFGPAVYP
jgi:hypothetical protein